MVASPVITALHRTPRLSSRLAALLALVAIFAIPGGAQAAAGDFAEYLLPTSGSGPSGIATGPEGGVWFTEYSSSKIGRIDPATGAIVEYALGAGSGPYGITAGPDGAMWFTEAAGNKIGRIDPASGVIVEYPISTAASFPRGITKGPDGGVWFVEDAGNRIGRVDPATGAIVEYVIPTAASGPEGITGGPDGGLWFTESSGSVNQIGRIDPTTHAFVEYPVPDVGGTTARPLGIATGADGNLWFTAGQGNRVGKIAPATGAVTQYPMPSSPSFPQGITAAPDGNLWFTQYYGNRIASIDPTTAVITQYAIPTPAVRPVAITAGPDGNLWFAEQTASTIGRLTLSYRLSVTRAGVGTGSVASSPSGLDCGATCTAVFDGGTSITLTATAADGSVFTGWSGDCSGTSRTCTVAMQRARSVTASFASSPAAAASTAVSVAKPVLSARLSVPRAHLRVGQVMRVGIRVGSSVAAAASTRACLRLPSALVVVKPGSSRRVGSSLCFSIGRVPVGATRTRYVSVRAVGTRAASVVVRGSVSADRTARVVATPMRIVIVPRPSMPLPVTG